jgi:hypothetical protein
MALRERRQSIGWDDVFLELDPERILEAENNSWIAKWTK